MGVLLLFVGTLGVCFFFDISPGTALQMATRRLVSSRLQARTSNRADTPYHKVGRAQNALHRPVLLNLETSDGSGQATHPDVVHVPSGFGLMGCTYWMVCTPYPFAQSHLENPEIFASHDGISWIVPGGLQNPLVPTPKAVGDHNSDPDMIFHKNKLWLFYRQTSHGNERKGPIENAIYLMKSADGVQWSVPEKILSEQTGTQLLSPAVIHDGTCFAMWTIEMHNRELKLMYRSSPDARNWSFPESCQIIGLDKGRHPWHIDVIRETSKLSAILVSYLGPDHSGGSGSRIHYAYSEDNGRTWFASGFLLDQVYEFESQLQYRASLRLLDEDRRMYGLWYSAASLANVFSIAYVDLVRMENRLRPLNSASLQCKALMML